MLSIRPFTWEDHYDTMRVIGIGCDYTGTDCEYDVIETPEYVSHFERIFDRFRWYFNPHPKTGEVCKSWNDVIKGESYTRWIVCLARNARPDIQCYAVFRDGYYMGFIDYELRECGRLFMSRAFFYDGVGYQAACMTLIGRGLVHAQCHPENVKSKRSLAKLFKDPPTIEDNGWLLFKGTF